MGRLFLRIFLWFWLGSICLVVVLAASLVMAQPDVITTWRFIGRTAMRSLGSQVANAYERQGGDAAASLVASVSREGRFRVWLYTVGGQLVAGPSPIANAAEIVAGATRDQDVERAESDGRALLARRTTSESGAVYVVVWEAPRFWASQISPARFVLRLLALMLTAGIVCWWLTWQITKPVQTLRAAARRFADGDLAVRVGHARELRRGDELSELAHEFDRMASRIEELLTSQERLLVDISHELRSPLARLSLALDLARRRLGDDVPEHHRIDREIRRLDELIEQLLTLARLQGQKDRPELDFVDVRALVHEVAHDARFEAEAVGRTVVVQRECEATMKGSRALLRSAIENVVRNAVRYAPEQTEVRIAMEQHASTGRLSVIVCDRGPGVPKDELPRLFDPFFRVDAARDRASGGVGLGLAITREAVLAHGGTVSADNDPAGGLIVRLELPTAFTIPS
jgi:signal transduction histidine kinase